MARNFNFAPAASSTNGAPSKKADAFVNLLLPTKSGGRKQVGAISLRLDNPLHAQIIERLDQDLTGPDEGAQLKSLMNQLIVSYVRIDTSEGADQLEF